MFYQEQKTQRQKDTLSAEDRLKHQEGLNKMNEYRESIQQNKNESASLETSLAPAPSSLIPESTLINNTSFTTLDSLLNISDGLSSMESSVVETGEDDTTKPKAITKSLELGGEDSKEITLEEETIQLMSDDPWMQRKMAEKAEKEAAAAATEEQKSL